MGVAALVGCANSHEADISPAIDGPSVQMLEDRVVLSSINVAIELGQKGNISAASIKLDENLGTVYAITLKDGTQVLLPYGGDSLSPGREKFHQLLASQNPPIIIKNDLTASQRLENVTQWIFPILLTIYTIAGILFYRNSRKNDPFAIVKSEATFDDVRGNPENVATIKGLMDLIEHSKNIVGAKPPRGVLFVGPPGTGKTLMAKAIAGEMGYNFIECTGADFDSMFVSAGAAKVKTLFRRARKHAPCIVFIDEIDGIGAARSDRSDSVSRETAKILNTLLTQMDGFSNKNKEVYIIAATNRPEILDPALLRPGRFDRTVHIAKPVTVEQRADIVDLYLTRKREEAKVSEDITAIEIARITTDFSPAELSEVMNSAAFHALQNGRETIEWEDVFESIDRIKLGEKLQCSAVASQDRERIQVHELMGHFLMAVLLERSVSKVSVEPRQKALAHVAIKEQSGLSLATQRTYMRELMLLLAGPAAEQVMYGEFSNGAGSDFDRSRKLIRDLCKNNMIGFSMTPGEQGEHEYTMSPEERQRAEVFFAAAFASTVDVLEQVDQNSVRAMLAKMAEKLTVSGSELDDLIEECFDQAAIEQLKTRLSANIERLRKPAVNLSSNSVAVHA